MKHLFLAIALAWLVPGALAAQDLLIAFRKLATEHGYLNRAHPRRYGGSEQTADPIKARIVQEEFSRVHAPREVFRAEGYA